MRLFIAIPIPQPIKNKLCSILRLPENYKIVAKENLHITLSFLGEIKETFLTTIIKTIDTCIKDERSFNITIDSLGQFPKKGLPNVIFFTSKEKNKHLNELANKINKSIMDLGITIDNKFKYHITIARRKKHINDSTKYIFSKIKLSEIFLAKKVILFKSVLHNTGPEYLPLWNGFLK